MVERKIKCAVTGILSTNFSAHFVELIYFDVKQSIPAPHLAPLICLA